MIDHHSEEVTLQIGPLLLQCPHHSQAFQLNGSIIPLNSNEDHLSPKV